MSAVSGDDKLRIPIEIETGDLKELNETLNNISKAESDLRALPRKGKGTGDTGSRAALPTSRGETPFEGGIFEQPRTGLATPTVPGRDKTSRQAFTRENEFKKLRERVDNVEEASSIMGSGLAGMAANLGFAGIANTVDVNRSSLKGGKKTLPIGFTQKIKGGAESASGAVSFAKGGFGGIGGMLGGLATKAFVPIAILTTMYELVTTILQELFRPGGYWDIRWKRQIDNEVASLTDRQEKAELQQGIRILRITPVAGFRGPSTARLAHNFDRNQQVWLNDFNMESRTKGFFD
jgi:hypothetical protein